MDNGGTRVVWPSPFRPPPFFPPSAFLSAPFPPDATRKRVPRGLGLFSLPRPNSAFRIPNCGLLGLTLLIIPKIMAPRCRFSTK